MTMPLEELLVELRASEQRRLGRELHDTVVQDLAALTMFAERLATRLADVTSPLAHQAAELTRHVARVRGNVHALSRGLLPFVVAPDQLPAALELLAASARELHGIDCPVRCELSEGSLVPAAEHLARIALESIRNAIGHGKATRVAVTLTQRDERLTLTIVDNGEGFETARATGGVGLSVMRYRAAKLGGPLTLTSVPGIGTRVRCECPVGAENRQESLEASEDSLPARGGPTDPPKSTLSGEKCSGAPIPPRSQPA